MAYLGAVNDISKQEGESIHEFLTWLSENTSPFVAKVSGHGYLGEDLEKIIITESIDLQRIRDQLLESPFIREIIRSVEQHPSWIPHISTSKAYRYGELILFNRLAFWWGEDRRVYDFGTPGLIAID